VSFIQAPVVPYRPAQCPTCDFLVNGRSIADSRCKGFTEKDAFGELLGSFRDESTQPCPKYKAKPEADGHTLDSASEPGAREKTISAPGSTLEEKIEATKKLLGETTHILDLRAKMAEARKSLAAAQMRILLEPRGYGSPDEYRDNCRAVMKNSREIKRLAKELRKVHRNLGQDEPSSISEALQKAAEAEGQFTFWERIRSSFG
jgi:hypothetical protein